MLTADNLWSFKIPKESANSDECKSRWHFNRSKLAPSSPELKTRLFSQPMRPSVTCSDDFTTLTNYWLGDGEWCGNTQAAVATLNFVLYHYANKTFSFLDLRLLDTLEKLHVLWCILYLQRQTDDMEWHDYGLSLNSMINENKLYLLTCNVRPGKIFWGNTTEILRKSLHKTNVIKLPPP